MGCPQSKPVVVDSSGRTNQGRPPAPEKKPSVSIRDPMGGVVVGGGGGGGAEAMTKATTPTTMTTSESSQRSRRGRVVAFATQQRQTAANDGSIEAVRNKNDDDENDVPPSPVPPPPPRPPLSRTGSSFIRRDRRRGHDPGTDNYDRGSERNPRADKDAGNDDGACMRDMPPALEDPSLPSPEFPPPTSVVDPSPSPVSPPLISSSLPASSPSSFFVVDDAAAPLTTVPAVDPRWEYIFTTLSSRILDPMDLQSTLDAVIGNTLDRLTPAEISFVRRRVKIAMRSILDGVSGEGGGGGTTADDVSSTRSHYPNYASREGGGGGGGGGGRSRKKGKFFTYSPLSTAQRLLPSSSSMGGGHDGVGGLGGGGRRSPSPNPLEESHDRSRETYRKERLLDVVAFRKVFEGGGRCLRDLRASCAWAVEGDNNARTTEVCGDDNDDGGGTASAPHAAINASDGPSTNVAVEQNNRKRSSSGLMGLTGAGRASLSTTPSHPPTSVARSKASPLRQATSSMSPDRSDQEEGADEDVAVGVDSSRGSGVDLLTSDVDATCRIDIYGSAFLLLLYMSESRWDYVAEIAKLSAAEVGLIVDVNKVALLRDGEEEKEKEEGEKEEGIDGDLYPPSSVNSVRTSTALRMKLPRRRQRPPPIKGRHDPMVIVEGRKIPPPPGLPSLSPPSEVYNRPDLVINEPVGVNFSSLCFLMAMALRGTRRQRVNLLFYFLLPPKELHSVLASHPAGGFPTWLLEIDEEVVLSYDSLKYYYNHEGVMLPLADHRDNLPASRKRRRLCIDAKGSIEVLAALLAESMSDKRGRKMLDDGDYGTRRLISLLESNGESAKKTDQLSTDVSGFSSVKCQTVNAMLLRASQDGGASTALADLSPSDLHCVSKFVELSTSLDNNNPANLGNVFDRLSWSMKDFVEWADVAMNDIVLDSIMFCLFGTGILPTAQMEFQLVAQRWIDWNLTNVAENSPAPFRDGDDSPLPAPLPVKGGLRRMFSMTHALDLPSEEVVKSVGEFNYVWGGIGGSDGKGGLGNGVVYCIDKRWWDEWVAFSGWRNRPKSDLTSMPKSLKRPRELSTERLIDRSPGSISSGSRGSYEPMKSSVVSGVDYVLVPPGVWNVLYEMYGGGPPLPRMIFPDYGNRGTYMNGGVDGGDVHVGDESVEVISHEAEPVQHYPKEMPLSVRVATHPWIVHCQICDPQQPFRKGDAGQLSIRIMVVPEQPLWRLFGEIVVRLPICYAKARDSHGEGRSRLWRFENTASTAGSRYGPWALLCKNRCAEIPIITSSYDKYKERWETYAEKHSVESIGISDGMRLMYEFAVANKDGTFTWPREAAAKATTARRIADEDAKFRLLLRGLGTDSEPLKAPIIRTMVDAMDSTGCWYQAIIVNVDNTTMASGDTESDGHFVDGPASNHSNADEFREYTHVRVNFNSRTGNHEEWIDVKSDRLAVRGRMTSGSVENIDSDPNSEEANSSSETKSRLAAGISKKKDTNETTNPDPNNNAVCLFPSYGACGLMNLGNTCYANSGWQCMSYLPLLRSYLLSGQFKINGDINMDNPLGTGGKIIEEFSDLLRFMWSGKFGARAPQKFRVFLGKCRSQYSGADQQDAQELINDMFDMLHEDGNRVKKKPYVEALEDKFIEKSELSRVGQEAWRRFLRRNRSAISDLSTGQLFNRVTCPECNHSSPKFDEFNMLSLPFPTMTEVIFQCTVVRRATALNCFNFVENWRHHKDLPLPKEVNSSPPSKELIFEEYIIPMSRLADIGDLKMKLQNLSGIQAKDMRVCKKEDIATNTSDNNHSFTNTHTRVSLLPDKEGPCLRLLQQESLDDDPSPIFVSIIAFETTLYVRPIEHQYILKNEKSDDASTTASERSNDSAIQTAARKREDDEIAQEYLKVYGDGNECIIFDTNPTLLAKAISRNLWPKEDKDFTLGLRVDAIDHRNYWFPGSVIELVEPKEGETDQTIMKVKIHFDNYASKWDEIYSIESFTLGRVCPLYSHASPRSKPTEFVVHHRCFDRKSKTNYLFGQSFYIQCHNEWSTARAGAHILAQALRFLKVSAFDSTENGNKMNGNARGVTPDSRKVISHVIRTLIASDKKCVESAVGFGQKTKKNDNHTDINFMSDTLRKKLEKVLPLLPFELRVITQEKEDHFPFSLVRTICNYMGARHALVLHWRENSEESPNDKPMRLLYAPPRPVIHPESRALLNAKKKDELGNNAIKRQLSSTSSHGGLHIGACLTEFCKEQQLEATCNWRCPRCEVVREGKQSMTLWHLPDLLTFHLKRFSASSRWREKISTRVDFPLTGLNMREWFAKESPHYRESNDESFIYDLIGVVNHYGGMTGGHYVATCKATPCSPDGEEDVAYNFNGAGIANDDTAEEEAAPSTRWSLVRSKEKEFSSNAMAKLVAESAEPLWLQFDDDLVEPIPPKNVVSETAYVLFYRRRCMRPANIAKYTSLG